MHCWPTGQQTPLQVTPLAQAQAPFSQVSPTLQQAPPQPTWLSQALQTPSLQRSPVVQQTPSQMFRVSQGVQTAPTQVSFASQQRPAQETPLGHAMQSASPSPPQTWPNAQQLAPQTRPCSQTHSFFLQVKPLTHFGLQRLFFFFSASGAAPAPPTANPSSPASAAVRPARRVVAPPSARLRSSKRDWSTVVPFHVFPHVPDGA